MHVERFVVCILGIMALNVGMVCKCCGTCRSHLVWLVFEGSIPVVTYACFHSKNFFCDLFFFRNSKREVRWERRLRGKCMYACCVKYKSIEVCCSQGTVKELS